MGTRMGMVIGLALLFAGWIFYRGVIKRDLAAHRGTLALGGLFVGVWAVLYCVFF